MIKKFLSLNLILAFLINTFGPLPARAGELVLPAPGVMVSLSPDFTPAHLKGITIHPDNALKFDFIIHKGDSNLSDPQKQEEYKKLIKYFLASLAVPDENQWVNLSPYEKDRIIRDDFGKTEMGRDLLSQDYLLKQITASLIYPEQGLGQKFWDRVYEQAYKQYGNTNIPVNTFNKVWIVPDNAIIYEKGNTAYVLKNHLKVMLEEDYLSKSRHTNTQASSVSSQVVREIVLPALEKEVNEGKNFAQLRQVYSGMILAAWYKRGLKESLLGKIYADKAKVKGVDQNPKNNEAIYQRYLQAFKKGVYNYIKEDTDKYTKQVIPRKYFSGGTKGFADFAQIVKRENSVDFAQASDIRKDISDADSATVALEEQGAALINKSDEAMNAKSLDDIDRQVIHQIQIAIARTSSERKMMDALRNILPVVLDDDIFIRRAEKQELEVFPSKKDTLIYAVSQQTLGIISPRLMQEILAIFDSEHLMTVRVEIGRRGHMHHAYYLIFGLAAPILIKADTAMFASVKYLNALIESGGILSAVDHLTASGFDIGPVNPGDVPANSLLMIENDRSWGAFYPVDLSDVSRGDQSYKLGELQRNGYVFYKAKSRGEHVQTGDLGRTVFALRPERPLESVEKVLGSLVNNADTFSAFYRFISDKGIQLKPVKSQPDANQNMIVFLDGSSGVLPHITRYFEVTSGMFKATPTKVYALTTSDHASPLVKGIFDLKSPVLLAIPEAFDFAQAPNAAMMVDKAAVVNPAKLTDPGGIDFNAANLNLQIRRDGKGVPLPLPQQDLEHIKIDGLVPIILEIKPAMATQILSELQVSG